MLTTAIDFDVKLQTVAFIEGNHASAFDRADVDECVRLAVIALDKAKAFHRVEEFDRARCRFAGQLALGTSATAKATPVRTVKSATFARFARSAFRHGHGLAVNLDVGRRNFAAAIDQREFERLAFCQTRQARLFDRADVHKHIFAAFIALDEAKTFLTVEKLNDAFAFADNLCGHAATRTAAASAATKAAASAASTAAEAAAVSAAKAATTAAAAKATAAITAAIATLLIKGIDTFFAETIALVAPASTTATTAAVISVETHALNVTFASSLNL